MVSRTTLRATLWTLLCTAGAGLGHWLMWMCCIPLIITVRREPTVMEWIRNFQVGFTPPFALGYSFAFCTLDFTNYGGGAERSGEAILYGLLGIVTWLVLGTLLAVVSSTRFRVVTGRMPFPRPQPALGQRPLPSSAQPGPSEVIAKTETQ